MKLEDIKTWQDAVAACKADIKLAESIQALGRQILDQINASEGLDAEEIIAFLTKAMALIEKGSKLKRASYQAIIELEKMEPW